MHALQLRLDRVEAAMPAAALAFAPRSLTDAELETAITRATREALSGVEYPQRLHDHLARYEAGSPTDGDKAARGRVSMWMWPRGEAFHAAELVQQYLAAFDSNDKPGGRHAITA